MPKEVTLKKYRTVPTNLHNTVYFIKPLTASVGVADAGDSYILKMPSPLTTDSMTIKPTSWKPVGSDVSFRFDVYGCMGRWQLFSPFLVLINGDYTVKLGYIG